MASATIDKCKTKARIPESVSSFIKKTYELLEEQKFPEIVDWNEEGTAIIIKNPIEFGQKVLSIYFKHSNLTSFVRQLNMYDFHKRRTQKYDHVYYHDLFQRGKKHLLQEIKRKSQDNTLANIQKAIETLETAQGTQKQDTNVSNYESQLLKKLNKDALSRISSLENKVKDLTIQNQALWNQVAHQSQKEDLLVSLLASFMKKKGITLDQLPNILNNQFNLPHIDLNLESKLSEKPITDNIHKEMRYDWHKANMAVNAGEFLSLSEDLSSSTEISPEYNEKSSGTNEGLLSVNEALNDMRLKGMEQITCFKPFNQEWAIPINNYSMNEGGEDESFGKIFFGKPNMLGKRNFDIQKGESLGVQKFLKQNPFNNRSQNGNPFLGNGNSEELSEMKIRKNDSLTDSYLNTEGQNNNNFDLLSFS